MFSRTGLHGWRSFRLFFMNENWCFAVVIVSLLIAREIFILPLRLLSFFWNLINNPNLLNGCAEILIKFTTYTHNQHSFVTQLKIEVQKTSQRLKRNSAPIKIHLKTLFNGSHCLCINCLLPLDFISILNFQSKAKQYEIFIKLTSRLRSTSFNRKKLNKRSCETINRKNHMLGGKNILLSVFRQYYRVICLCSSTKMETWTKKSSRKLQFVWWLINRMHYMK